MDPRTGRKTHFPFASWIDCERSKSIVTDAVSAKGTSNGVTILTIPSGTRNDTAPPFANTPSTAVTTIRTWAYLPVGTRSIARTSATSRTLRRSTVVAAIVRAIHPSSSAAFARWMRTSEKVTFTWAQSVGASRTRTTTVPVAKTVRYAKPARTRATPTTTASTTRRRWTSIRLLRADDAGET